VADSEPAWGSVDKTRLPRAAFADHGETGSKSTWGYPHHWVRNGGEVDEDGIYTSGDMYLHAGGLNAAWSAAQGGRSGQEASAGVKSHLQAHRRALGLDKPQEQGKAFFLPRVAALIFNRALAIEPARLDAIVTIFDRKSGLIESESSPSMPPADVPPYELIDGTAVIPIFGELVNRTYGLNPLSGLTSYPALGALHAQALADPAVQNILFLINSPGGDVHGLFDLADQIAASRTQKPIAALASDYALSAAYVLAAATGNVFVTQSAQVGSLGVVMEIRDTSAADQAAGIKRQKLYAGARKLDGSSHAPQTDAALAALQAEVDTYYEMLTAKVAGYLGTSSVAMQATEAGVFIGAQALQHGLAHGMSTLDGMLIQTHLPVRGTQTGVQSRPPLIQSRPASAYASHADRLVGAHKEIGMEITTIEALATAYPDLTRTLTDQATALLKTEAAQRQAEAVKVEQERIQEILGLAGYTLPKLVAQALWENGGLTGDKAARLFLEQKYERTQAVASAFLADAIEPAKVAPLSDSQQQFTPEQALVNKQMGIDQLTFNKFATLGLDQQTRS
jgi:ClpP class serine protease